MDELDLQTIPATTFVRQIRALDQTESTNTVAADWSLQLADDELPALVITDRQTAGRGRGQNRWWSGPGALTFSLVILPGRHGIPTVGWPALSITVGAGIATALQRLAPDQDLRLKWPNDVYLDGRKIAGILIESPPGSQQRLIVGIGINVNNSLSGAPEEIQTTAVALCDALDRPVSRTEVLTEVCRQLEQDLRSLSLDSPELRIRWRRLCLLAGRSVVVTDPLRIVAGTCLGLDDDGALRVQTGQSVERLFSGRVTEWT